LCLSACTTEGEQNTPPAPVKQANAALKNPLAVAVYAKPQPIKAPYTVLGKATISKYNPGGIKRQEACLHDSLRSLAASMGGDAVINVSKDDKTMTGTVIAYQPVKKQALSSVS
jgi:hypothetical protein